jgi:hypothetical protein
MPRRTASEATAGIQLPDSRLKTLWTCSRGDGEHVHYCTCIPGGCGDAQIAAALVAAGNVLRHEREGCRAADRALSKTKIRETALL